MSVCELPPNVIVAELPAELPVRLATDSVLVSSPTEKLNEAYVNSLYKPYEDAIAGVDDVESILGWIPQVFSTESTQVMLVDVDKLKEVNNYSADGIRDVIKNFVVRTFFSNYVQEGVTPWSITEHSKHEEALKLFGIGGGVKEPHSPHRVYHAPLPVTVVVGPSQYVHEWDQDTTYGILLGLQGNPGIKLYLAGIEITEQMLNSIYSVPAGVLPDKALSAVFHNGRKQFNDDCLLTGFVTACGWLNLDHRTMIRDLKQLTLGTDGTKLFTPLSF
jgi:hypothetical protein